MLMATVASPGDDDIARDVDDDDDNRRPAANNTDTNTVKIDEDVYGHIGACLKLTQHQLQKRQETKTGATATTPPPTTTVEQTNKTPEQNPKSNNSVGND